MAVNARCAGAKASTELSRTTSPMTINAGAPGLFAEQVGDYSPHPWGKPFSNVKVDGYK
ncbi:hypothetical protein [Brenneria goodwinii]|uniref:hypothetical protein n=1 Tax=Brenneria goodwinii TaxID=1109412 RepID=UPI0036F3C7C5